MIANGIERVLVITEASFLSESVCGAYSGRIEH